MKTSSIVFSLVFSVFAFSELNLEGQWKSIDPQVLHHCILPKHLEQARKGIFTIKRNRHPQQHPDGGYYDGSSGGQVRLIEWLPESAGLPEGVFKCPIAGEAVFQGSCAVCHLEIRSPEYYKTVFCAKEDPYDRGVHHFYTKGDFIYILAHDDYDKEGVCEAGSKGRRGWILKKTN